jgi:hypothetical protein
MFSRNKLAQWAQDKAMCLHSVAQHTCETREHSQGFYLFRHPFAGGLTRQVQQDRVSFCDIFLPNEARARQTECLVRAA